MPCTKKTAVITIAISFVVGLPVHIGLSATQNPEAQTIPAELLTGTAKRRNPAFAISAESVLQKVTENRDIILIDVRKRVEFIKFRIPDSINIPLFAIKTKAFLKSKPLVIVNEGYNYDELEQECAHLREAGFKVWILNGGLNYWRGKGAPLEGDAFAQKTLNRMGARSFFAEKDYENWIVINVSVLEKSEVHALIPRLIFLPYENDEEKFIETLKSAMVKSRHDQFLSVLICSEKGEYYEHIERLVKKTDITNVFFLEGGLEAYKKFLEQQALIRQAKDSLGERIKGCTSCP
jgi:rhodanese-related sulfurtransferase